MSEIKTSVVVDLAGNLPRKAKSYGSALDRMSNSGRRSMRLLASSVRGLDRGLSRLGNRYTALAAGGVITVAGKQVVDFDAQLTRTGTNVNISADRIDRLKDSLFRVANQKNVRLPVDQLFSSVDQFLNKTGDMDFVEKNLDVWGVALQGLGSDARATGLLMAQFWEKGIRNPDQVIATLDRMFGQFAIGTVQVGEIARVAPELFSVVLSKGPAAVTQITALQQIYAKTAGSAEKAVTSLRGTFAVFNDPKKADIIDRLLTQKGFAKARKANGEFRDLHQLLIDIVEISGNNEQNLFTLFGREEALFGLKALIDPQNKIILKEMVEGQIENGLTMKAASKNAATMKAGLDSLRNSYRKLSDSKLSGPISDLAAFSKELKPDQVEAFFDKAITGAKVLGGVIVAHKLLKFVASMSTVFRGGLSRGGKGGGRGGVAGALGAAGAAPVYVVNMPGGGFGPGGGIPSGAGKPGRPPVRKGFKAAVSLAKAGAPVGALATSGVTGAATVAGGVLAAGAAGVTIGTVMYKAADEGPLMHQVGKDVTRLLAFFGNDEASAALRRDDRFTSSVRAATARKELLELSAATNKFSALAENRFALDPLSGEITIKVEGPGKVTQLESRTPGVDLTTQQNLGPSMHGDY